MPYVWYRVKFYLQSIGGPSLRWEDYHKDEKGGTRADALADAKVIAAQRRTTVWVVRLSREGNEPLREETIAVEGKGGPAARSYGDQ